MNFRDLKLSAGEFNYWPVFGRYMRVLTAIGDIDFVAEYEDGRQVNSTTVAGIGLDLKNDEATSQNNQKFKGLRFQSKINQTIRVLVSDFPTTDSRSVGKTNIEANANFNGLSKLTLTGGVDTIPAGDRAQLIIYAAETNTGIVWLGGSVERGIPIKAGGDFNPMVKGEIAVTGTANDVLYLAEIQ